MSSGPGPWPAARRGRRERRRYPGWPGRGRHMSATADLKACTTIASRLRSPITTCWPTAAPPSAISLRSRSPGISRRRLARRTSAVVAGAVRECSRAMAVTPARLVAAFGAVLDVVEPLEVEPGRFVAFEYIGQRDFLGEVGSRTRIRGSMTTSADAAIRYRNSDGCVEIALIEWKYCEDYRGQELSAGRHGNRRDRYRALWAAADCPVRTDLIPYEDLVVEPFYQLFRQQLLAHEMEKAHEGGPRGSQSCTFRQPPARGCGPRSTVIPTGRSETTCSASGGRWSATPIGSSP